jgi:hypothetical protein
MFAEFNESQFPIIKITLNNSIENDDDFNNFLNGWLKYYQQKKEVIFLFDTINVGYIPIKYCFKMSTFIRELKQVDKQYLQRSFIVANSWIVKTLLRIIFSMQSPVATVYIVRTQELALLMNQDIIDTKSISLYNYYAYYPK